MLLKLTHKSHKMHLIQVRPCLFLPQTVNKKPLQHVSPSCNEKKTKKKNNTNWFSAEMERRISKRPESVYPRYAFASVCASYCFFKGLRLMAVTVAAKIDKNSVIPNKWAAETRCRVCNGILQRSAVPTAAPVHPNLITYPDSPYFPITGGGEAVCT